MLKVFLNRRISFKPQRIFTFSTEIKTSETDKKDELVQKYLRGIHRQNYSLKPGDKIHNFELLKIENFKDFHIVAYILQHAELKIPFIHLDTADMTNCFALIFRTPAINNKGIANIIEHMNFCGSKQFPIRDPFLHMSKRSLNEHTNAWNGPGYTCYPFCTNNVKDFYNLLSVYLDISFNPLLNYSDFLNEGWRYEFLNPDERKELNFRGNCFDQMKTYFQIPENILLENIKGTIFKNNEYSFVNGGKPDEIVKLSYLDLMDYHNKFYHPSNCRIFSYGDIDFTKHLEFIEDYFMNKLTEKNIKKKFIPYNYTKTQKINAVETVKISCPPNAELEKDKQVQIGISFLCEDVTENPFLAISFHVLAYILFETPYSPFFQILLGSGLATGYCPGYGFDMSTREGTFTFGVKNISESQIKEIEMMVITKFQEIVKNGIDRNLIELAINQIELNSKIPKSDFGLTLLNNILGIYSMSDNHVKNSGLEFLKSNENMKKFLEFMKKKDKYFEKLIQKYFLDNDHKVKIIMKPDNDYIKDQIENEKNLLISIEKQKNTEEKEKIIIENNNLKKELEKLQDIRCLPMLQLFDIPLQIEKSEYLLEKINDIPFYFVSQPLNGTTFLRIKFDLKDLPENLKKYLDLFAGLFPKLGSKTLNCDKMSEIFAIYSSHFEVFYEGFSDSSNVNKIEKTLIVQIAFLDQNIETIMNSFTDLISSPDFADHTNNSQLLNYFASDKVNDLIENTLEYAISHSASDLSLVSQWNDKLDFVKFLSQMALNFLKTTDVKRYLIEITRNLEILFDFFMKKKRMSFIVHSDISNKEEIERRLSILYHNIKLTRKNFLEINEINNVEGEKENLPFKPKFKRNYFALPINSNYVIETFRIPHFSHEDLPKLRVFAELINSELNNVVVDQGGAYGSGCFITSNGTLSYYSFKDPHTIQTYESFEKASLKIANGIFSEDDLNYAILAVFSKIDKSVEPQNKALNKIVFNINDELWGDYRGKILNVTKNDVLGVVKKYIINAMAKDYSSKVIFGSSNNNLEGLLSKGWAIQRTLEDISVKESNYYQNKDVKPLLKYKI